MYIEKVLFAKQDYGKNKIKIKLSFIMFMVLRTDYLSLADGLWKINLPTTIDVAKNRQWQAAQIQSY